MATKSTAKRTTAADLAAAVELGARSTAAVATLPSTEHACGIVGCRHGAAHGAPQPDRQIKLVCPNCGMVIRTTSGALRRAGGSAPICGGDAGTFAEAARRTYKRAH